MAWGLLGTLAAGAASAWGARQQQRHSQSMAREQMQFQERMSSTAHQRQMADLEASGVNPLLMSSLGGAASPGGAMGHAEDAAGRGVSSALQARLARSTLELQDAQTQDARAQAYIHSIQGQREASMHSARLMTPAGGLPSPHNRDGNIYGHMARQELLNMQAQVGLHNASSAAALSASGLKDSQAVLARLGVPAAQAQAELWRLGGAPLAGVSSAAGIFRNVMPGLRSRRTNITNIRNIRPTIQR